MGERVTAPNEQLREYRDFLERKRDEHQGYADSLTAQIQNLDQVLGRTGQDARDERTMPAPFLEEDEKWVRGTE